MSIGEIFTLLFAFIVLLFCRYVVIVDKLDDRKRTMNCVVRVVDWLIRVLFGGIDYLISRNAKKFAAKQAEITRWLEYQNEQREREKVLDDYRASIGLPRLTERNRTISVQ